MTSHAQQSRQRSATGSSMSARERMANANDYTLPSTTISTMVRHFDPCAATAGMFLYAQGNSIVCCHHDTLTIERRFSRHPDEVQLLAVDNQSERGAGRLVVSCDASQNTIVWDIMSGNEVARFASFSNLTAVAWMRNGAIAFGNDSGTIILFEPETSEHISFRTIDQISVTALAPAADCRTFAIGYQNGSVLICNLQPRFTILHNLTTSRGPSPIVSLAWHASSARQKSDMLAVQTYDGDMRVWSVAKSHQSTSDPAKVVRILKRTDNYIPGPNWMNWSKNGRIIQFSEGETLSWDVRTKHVTYDSIPTLEHVRGLAVYGPGATLFTLGPNNTVQQFDLNAPAVLVTDVQHPANLLPPSPPVSIEEQEKVAAAAAAAAAATSSYGQDTSGSEIMSSSALNTSESEISIHLDGGVSESDDDRLSPPYGRMVVAQQTDSESDVGPSASARSYASSLSSHSGVSSRTPGRNRTMSTVSRGMTENTYISMGSSLKSSAISNLHNPRKHHQRQQQQQQHQSHQSVTSFSVTTGSTYSMASSSVSRPSRLRNEVPRSPDDAKVHDLFQFTRSRLSDLTYRLPPPPSTGARLTNDDLRRQMLATIFGWTMDIDDLVRDEMDRYPAGSPNRILLAKWLGDIDADIMAASSESMTSSDWMLLALSGIGNQASQHKLGRAYTQRLLESGDLHHAATIMIGMGDYNDAIEIYGSHHKYMEALIVACLFYPSVWERQSHLVKKWGEWAIKNGRKELAIRCFACTGKESTEPWTSPSAAQMTFQNINAALPEVLSPPLSPPSVMQRGPQRSIAKTSALKLITNFGDSAGKAKFFYGQEGGGATPIAAGVTPIIDSAIVDDNDIATAVLRPSHRSAFNTPSSARPTTGFNRQRLPSIGEAPTDESRKALRNEVRNMQVPPPPAERLQQARAAAANTLGLPADMSDENKNMVIGMALQRASTSSPLQRRKEPPPSPSPASLAMLMEGRHSRNGPRNRMPAGLDLHLVPIESNVMNAVATPEQTGISNVSSNRFHWPTRRRGPGSVSSSVTSNSGVTHGSRSYRYRTGDAPNTSKTLDDYINSLEAAKTRVRASSTERRQRSTSRHRRPSVSASTNTSGAPTPTLRGHNREVESIERAPSRGYAGSKSGKHSPRSPVPMSPEDLINMSTPRMFGKDAEVLGDGIAPLTVRKTSIAQHSRPSSKSRPTSRASSRGRAGRNRSPDGRLPTLEIPRGRNTSRASSAIRSPSSPLPFANNAAPYYASEDDEDDYVKALEEQERFRNGERGHGSRAHEQSQVRRGESPGSAPARSRSRRRRPTPTIDLALGHTKKERGATGPPPAPSAIAVAAGIGGGHDAHFNAQEYGEELGQRRTQSAMSDRGNRGDLRQLSKDERARRKVAAARELEERRMSLVRRPLAPPVMHPDELSPALNAYSQPKGPEMFDMHIPDQFTAPTDLPMRSQTTEPGSMSKASRTRSTSTSRGPSIGLPATPKAMRLVMEPGAGSSVPSLPPMLSSATYQRSSSVPIKASPGRSAAKKEEEPVTLSSFRLEAPQEKAPQEKAQDDLLTLLPSTVYQPPSRGAIPRSMSAPPEKLFGKSFTPQESSRRVARGPKLSISEEPSYMENPSAQANASSNTRRPSLDDLVPPPPPPPPAPPMLRELAHLAQPPPPPPAPLPFGSASQPVVYGGQTTGTIEVVMDDEDNRNSMLVPPPPPPPPPPPANAEKGQSRNGHRRGRSSTDNSIAGRFSRATDRMRSVSRGRNNPSRTRSPGIAFAPYESIQIPMAQSAEMSHAPYDTAAPPFSYSQRNSPPQQYQPQQYQPQQYQSPPQQYQGQQQLHSQMRTGLHQSELI